MELELASCVKNPGCKKLYICKESLDRSLLTEVIFAIFLGIFEVHIFFLCVYAYINVHFVTVFMNIENIYCIILSFS